MVVFHLTIFYILLQNVNACFPSGICGANPMCGQGILPPPPPPTIAFQPPCQRMGCGLPGTACGPFGCYRVRAAHAAHASTIYKPVNYTSRGRNTNPVDLNGWEDLEAASPSIAELRRSPQPQVDPNRAFLNCCMDRKLPDGCLQKCNYANYRKEMIIGMYLKQDSCPLEAVREIQVVKITSKVITLFQFCAAQGQDHRACCHRQGVANTLAGPKCLVFCDQRPNQVTQLDLTYLPCFERFNEMKTCFWNSFNLYKSRRP
ncbi:DB domain-containing protein [Aphelenchoides besseyi]|nr:DB domain-containing protein [Aphelenchoides besseyi]